VAAKTFKAKLTSQGPGGAWTFLTVPFSVEKLWRKRARLSVKGKINGYAFRSSIFPDGKGGHTMMVNKATQAGARARPGQWVKVVMAPDTAPRVVSVPGVLKKALARNRRAKSFFASLAPSHKKAYVEFITEAKQAETRARRVEKTLAMLTRQEKRM